MRLYEYEDEIKSWIEQNPNNPRIFLELVKLTNYFLRKKKACRSVRGYSEVATHIAEDIYLNILGGQRYHHLMGYINKIYRNYVNEYYKDYGYEIVSFDDDANVHLKDIIQDPNAYLESYLNNKLYIYEIDKVVDQCMLDSCRYSYHSKSFLNLKLSLLLTLIRGQRAAFHLNEAERIYLNMIKVNLFEKVRKESRGVDTVL